MLRIMVSCANGAGSSLMIKMKVEKYYKDLGIPIYIHHCAIAEGKNTAVNYDVVYTAMNFLNMFEEAEKKGVTVIGLRNIMSDEEIKQKTEESGILDNED